MDHIEDMSRARRRMERGASRRQDLWAALALAAASAAMWVLLSRLTGTPLLAKSPYCTYTLQAMAWRDGAVSLGRDYPWLELAVYEGDWYVSFPVVPTIPVWLLTFVFGSDVPDNALVKVYALVAMYSTYFALREKKYTAPSSALAAFAVAFAGSAMALSVQGAVWYQAQMAALALTCLAVMLTVKGRITWGLLCYALSVGCRPFNALYGPLLMLVWWRGRPDRSLRATVRGLWRGVALGLCVAAGLAAYNVVRFGDPFEFGTSYLPEFMRSAHGEFSLSHLPDNLRNFVLGLPFDRGADGALSLKRFGFGVFYAMPMLTMLIARFVRDLIRRRVTVEKAACFVLFLLQLGLLLLHRTFGGLQFGARYTVDLVPYAVLYMTLGGDRRLFKAEWPLYAAYVALSAAGVWAVHI